MGIDLDEIRARWTSKKIRETYILSPMIVGSHAQKDILEMADEIDRLSEKVIELVKANAELATTTTDALVELEEARAELANLKPYVEQLERGVVGG